MNLARKKSASNSRLFFIDFYHEKIGKQSGFAHQDALDALGTISSLSKRTLTLEVNLRWIQKNVSILTSRCQEALFIMGILEDGCFARSPLARPLAPSPALPLLLPHSTGLAD